MIVAGVDRRELADVDGRARAARVLRALQELLLRRVDVVLVGAAEAGGHVVVQRIDGVLQRLAEEVELRGVGVAVEEEDVVGVDLADGAGQPLVERADDRARLVGRLVHEVVSRHPRLVAIPRRDRLPHVDDAVLEVRVLPEQRAVGRVVRVPVVVLPAGQGVQVDDAEDPVGGARRDRAVEVPEAVLDNLERPRVGLQVAVVERDADAVEAEAREEGGVGVAVEGGEQAVEEQVGEVTAEHVSYARAHHRLVGGVARDEVLHVQPPADVHALEANGLTAVIDDLASVRTE
jgi:hypothetical protein